MFNYTVETSKSRDEAVHTLEENLKEEKFGVLWNFDLTAKLQEKGTDFDTPFTVLEVCNPQEANQVLSEDLLVGYFLPCKIVVYEENGTTKIGMPKPSALIEMVQNEMRSALRKLNVTEMGAVGDAFDPALHNAVAHIEDETLGENVVAQVFQKGYRIGDKVVRHAMVQVAN